MIWVTVQNSRKTGGRIIFPKRNVIADHRAQCTLGDIEVPSNCDVSLSRLNTPYGDRVHRQDTMYWLSKHFSKTPRRLRNTSVNASEWYIPHHLYKELSIKEWAHIIKFKRLREELVSLRVLQYNIQPVRIFYVQKNHSKVSTIIAESELWYCNALILIEVLSPLVGKMPQIVSSVTKLERNRIVIIFGLDVASPHGNGWNWASQATAV